MPAEPWRDLHRRHRMWFSAWMRPSVVSAVTVACLVIAGCTGGSGTTETAPVSGSDAPESCLDRADATRTTIQGPAVWARFCPGTEGRTAPAEIPSDALTAHLDMLLPLAVRAGNPSQATTQCRGTWGRTYRLQIGYADGEVAEVTGHTDPTCAGRLLADDARVVGPASVGVYGLVMRAFGRQYADLFDSAPRAPMSCPSDPRDPDSVRVDGPSTSLDTGYLLGERDPMTMPLTAVRGIVCTWSYRAGDESPAVRRLARADAERVRIGLHAIAGGMVDCSGSREPTHTAIVEDRTGTRRAVTIIESECSTVIRSNGGSGVGFNWLDR